MPQTPPSVDPSGRLLTQGRDGDNAAPLSVSEISSALKRTVEDRFGHVSVRGEISGFKRAASGHCYLALKDENAKLDAVMWKGTAQRLPFVPEDGIEVVASGKITTYPGRSSYQIVIERLELAGEGALMQLFERLKARLAAEGLFDPARRKPIPVLPRVIGIVTSPTGAVIRDILHRLADRFPSHVIIWPVQVQGDKASAQVAGAISGFDAIGPGGPVPRPDLLIIARGGGSIEDLWAFNEEPVVRAVAACSIPVISAVGHETDTTLCDFAADLRAPTPTAAAEMAVPVRADLLTQVRELGLRAQRVALRQTSQAGERLATQMRLMPRLDQLLSPQRQRHDEASDRLRRGLSHRLVDARRALADAGSALRPALLERRLMMARQALVAARLSPDLLNRRLKDGKARLDALARVAQSLDPKRLLAKGYALVTAGDRVIGSAAAASKEEALTLQFADGAIGVVPADGTRPPPRHAPRARQSAPSPKAGPKAGQGSLFD